MQITKVPTLKINKLTHEQFKRAVEAGRINDNEMYLTPDNAEPYIIPMVDEGDGALQFASGYQFSGEEMFQAIYDKRPIFVHVWDDTSIASLYTFSHSDHDEGVACFAQFQNFYDGHHTIIHKQIQINYDGEIRFLQTTHAIDTTLTKSNYAADAAAVGQRLAALETASTPAYTYGEEDLVPGETPLETGKLHFVYI